MKQQALLKIGQQREERNYRTEEEQNKITRRIHYWAYDRLPYGSVLQVPFRDILAFIREKFVEEFPGYSLTIQRARRAMTNRNTDLATVSTYGELFLMRASSIRFFQDCPLLDFTPKQSTSKAEQMRSAARNVVRTKHFTTPFEIREALRNNSKGQPIIFYHDPFQAIKSGFVMISQDILKITVFERLSTPFVVRSNVTKK